MTTGIEVLERVYKQLRAAGVVRSKAEFSEVLLGKSPSYLTSMRAKQRTVSDEIIMVLGDAVWSEMKSRQQEGDIQGMDVLRHAVAQVNTYLADCTVPFPVKDNAEAEPHKGDSRVPPWLRAISIAAQFWQRRTSAALDSLPNA